MTRRNKCNICIVQPSGISQETPIFHQAPQEQPIEEMPKANTPNPEPQPPLNDFQQEESDQKIMSEHLSSSKTSQKTKTEKPSNTKPKLIKIDQRVTKIPNTTQMPQSARGARSPLKEDFQNKKKIDVSPSLTQSTRATDKKQVRPRSQSPEITKVEYFFAYYKKSQDITKQRLAKKFQELNTKFSKEKEKEKGVETQQINQFQEIEAILSKQEQELQSQLFQIDNQIETIRNETGLRKSLESFHQPQTNHQINYPPHQYQEQQQQESEIKRRYDESKQESEKLKVIIREMSETIRNQSHMLRDKEQELKIYKSQCSDEPERNSNVQQLEKMIERKNAKISQLQDQITNSQQNEMTYEKIRKLEEKISDYENQIQDQEQLYQQKISQLVQQKDSMIVELMQVSNDQRVTERIKQLENELIKEREKNKQLETQVRNGYVNKVEQNQGYHVNSMKDQLKLNKDLVHKLQNELDGQRKLNVQNTYNELEERLQVQEDEFHELKIRNTKANQGIPIFFLQINQIDIVLLKKQLNDQRIYSDAQQQILRNQLRDMELQVTKSKHLLAEAINAAFETGGSELVEMIQQRIQLAQQQQE